MTRRLNRGEDFHPCALFDVWVLHGRKAADSKDGDINGRRLILEREEIGAVAGRASRQRIRVQGLDIADDSRECDLFQMVARRLIEDVTNRDGIGCGNTAEDEQSETD